MNADMSTLARTGVLAVALLNQFLVLTGHNTLPFSEEEVTEGLTAVLTAAVSLWTWWKNNAFTQAALKGDQVMRQTREMAELPQE